MKYNSAPTTKSLYSGEGTLKRFENASLFFYAKPIVKQRVCNFCWSLLFTDISYSSGNFCTVIMIILLVMEDSWSEAPISKFSAL